MEPTSKECLELKTIESKYDVSTIAINCLKLNEDDINNILENILFEFPITEIVFNVPKWLEIINLDSDLMKYIIEYSKQILEKLLKLKI